MIKFTIGAAAILALCLLLASTHHIIWAVVAYIVLMSWFGYVIGYCVMLFFIGLVCLIKSI